MPVSREKVFYKAVRRATAVLNSPSAMNEKLEAIVRGTGRSFESGASLLLLDSTNKKLIHACSWVLPRSYLQKGALDAEKSLGDVISGTPVVIADTSADSRLQYPGAAAQAGIASILAVPVTLNGVVIGSLRVYAKDRYEFSNQDIAFAATMANLAAVALRTDRERQEKQTAPALMLRRASRVAFANPSEEEFARILDFYGIEWAYEPRSFPLERQGDKITEMFTPDFYLPALDLYIEVTTLKQGLVTRKNRKLRRLRKLYPEIKIMLLRKGEYDLLLARYGVGPLGQARARGVGRVLFTAEQIQARVRELAAQISRDYEGRRPVVVGVQRGFVCFMADLIRQITVPLEIDFMTVSYYASGDHSMLRITKDLDINITGRYVILADGVVDTGMTLISVLSHLRSKNPAGIAVCTLLDKKVRRIVDIPVDYAGFEVEDEFVVGYGLDYREEYRNLPFIGVPELEKPAKSSSGNKKAPGNL